MDEPIKAIKKKINWLLYGGLFLAVLGIIFLLVWLLVFKKSSGSNPNPNPNPNIETKLPEYLVPVDFSGKFSLKNGDVAGRYLGTIQKGAGQGRTMENYLEATGASNAQLKSYSLDGNKYVSADGNLANTGTKFSLFKDKKDSVYYLGNPDNKEQCFSSAGVFGKCMQNTSYQWELDSSPLALYYPLKEFKAGGKQKFNISETNKCLLNTGQIGDCSNEAAMINYDLLNGKSKLQLKNLDNSSCIVGEGGKLGFKSCDDKTYWEYNLRDKNDTAGLLSYSDTNMALDSSGNLVPWYTIANGGNNYYIMDSFRVYPGLTYTGRNIGYKFSFSSITTWDEKFLASLIGKTIREAINSIMRPENALESIDEKANGINENEKVRGISVEIWNEPETGNNYEYNIIFFVNDPLKLNFCSEFKGIWKEFADGTNSCEKDPMYYTPRHIKDKSEIKFNVKNLAECRELKGKSYESVLNDQNLRQKIIFPTEAAELEALKSKGILEYMDYSVDKSSITCSYVSQNDRLLNGAPNTLCLKRPMNMFIYENPVVSNDATCNSYFNQFYL